MAFRVYQTATTTVVDVFKNGFFEESISPSSPFLLPDLQCADPRCILGGQTEFMDENAGVLQRYDGAFDQVDFYFGLLSDVEVRTRGGTEKPRHRI